jgi:hypothetical protein
MPNKISNRLTIIEKTRTEFDLAIGLMFVSVLFKNKYSS